MTTTIQQGIVKIEQFIQREENAVIMRLEQIWQAAKPSIQQLGMTELSMIETAALAYAESGFTNIAAVVESVVAQLPNIEKEVVAIITAAISTTAVAKVATSS